MSGNGSRPARMKARSHPPRCRGCGAPVPYQVPEGQRWPMCVACVLFFGIDNYRKPIPREWRLFIVGVALGAVIGMWLAVVGFGMVFG